VKSLRIVQIGDIHFPESKDKRIADIKDHSLSGTLSDTIVPKALQAVMRSLINVRNQLKPNALLICGDLTSKGELSGYNDCVKYIVDAMDLTSSAHWPTSSLHVVPGNHDVDRKLCKVPGATLYDKFVPLDVTWKNVALPVLATSTVRSAIASNGDCKLAIYSLNSCLGCGERRYLPGPIRDELQAVIDRYVTSAPPADAFELVAEQLDTPAFADNDISILIDAIHLLDSTTLPVVLAHHNLLPQALLRIELYTEVINGGLVRSRLAACHRPLLYCHGHIHSDPVEIVSDPRSLGGQLVSISAPCIEDGFNLIEIQYGRHARPLGCVLTAYRLRNDGGCEPTAPVRVPLVAPRDARTAADELLGAAIRASSATPTRFPQLKQQVDSVLTKVHQVKTVADALRTAEWFGLITIGDRKDPPEHWRIERVEA